MFKYVFRKLYNKCWRYFSTPLRFAKHIGVNVGDNCLISTKQWSTEPYLVTIGNNVQITNNVMILTHGGGNSVRKLIPNFDVFGKVIIEDWAYIGANSIILPGVTIGEGALVAAGSVVTKSVPPYTLVAGNPARIICNIDEYIERNKKYNCNTKGMSFYKKKAKLLSMEEGKFIVKKYMKV